MFPSPARRRHHFGTRDDVQVNPLTTRMVDSACKQCRHLRGALRRDTQSLWCRVSINLVLSHPVVSGKKTFTAFRGSLQIVQDRDPSGGPCRHAFWRELGSWRISIWLPGITQSDQGQPGLSSRCHPRTPAECRSCPTTGHASSPHQQQQRDAKLKVADTKSRKVGPKTVPPPPPATPARCEPSCWAAQQLRALPLQSIPAVAASRTDSSLRRCDSIAATVVAAAAGSITCPEVD